MVKLLCIGIGGFVGAITRYGVSGLIHRHFAGWPAGTLLVNVVGCFIIGAFMFLVEDRQLFSPNTRLFVTIGFLGSLTTFSTFGHETLEILRSGGIRLALANVAANVVLGLAAVFLGRMAVRVFGI